MFLNIHENRFIYPNRHCSKLTKTIIRFEFKSIFNIIVEQHPLLNIQDILHSRPVYLFINHLQSWLTILLTPEVTNANVIY